MVHRPGSPVRLREWARPHRTLLGLGAAAVAVALAALWLVVVPEKASETTGVQRFVLRYAHSLCWTLLAVAAGAWAVRAPRRVVTAAAWSALAAYAAFLLAVVL